MTASFRTQNPKSSSSSARKKRTRKIRSKWYRKVWRGLNSYTNRNKSSQNANFSPKSMGHPYGYRRAGQPLRAYIQSLAYLSFSPYISGGSSCKRKSTHFANSDFSFNRSGFPSLISTLLRYRRGAGPGTIPLRKNIQRQNQFPLIGPPPLEIRVEQPAVPYPKT